MPAGIEKYSGRNQETRLNWHNRIETNALSAYPYRAEAKITGLQ